MLTKIIIQNKAYEVDLLQAHEVIEDIQKKFIGSDTLIDLKKEGTEPLNKVINQYIDNYEKVEYKNKDYFILKSRIPVEFKEKSYTKKYIGGGSMTARVLGSLALPIMFFISNTFDMVCNFKNMVKTAFGSTKINAKFTDTETIFLSISVLVLNIFFWIYMINAMERNHIPVYSIFVIQAINMLLGVLKPFKYHYNQIENYKLASYTFDSKYDNVSSSPLERLNAMKKNTSKKEIDFDFVEEDQKETAKGKNYANY